MKYWLMKTEPGTYSIEDLAKEKRKTTCWEGVRNYQARNMMRDDFKKGDRVLFYHSGGKDPAVVGTAKIAKGAYPDHFAWDSGSNYYDPKSSPENPRWFMVDVQLDKAFEQPVTLSQMRNEPQLEQMELLRKGSRLSVQPVTESEFEVVLKMAEAAKNKA
ncbi:EVE domain-containing protein [Rosistilla oblonga]|uniref:EVE domain-containing protein n=1 Tax=Rosistilla oblonga TaxID=2527990 RepID=UPI003A978858